MCRCGYNKVGLDDLVTLWDLLLCFLRAYPKENALITHYTYLGSMGDPCSSVALGTSAVATAAAWAWAWACC